MNFREHILHVENEDEPGKLREDEIENKDEHSKLRGSEPPLPLQSEASGGGSSSSKPRKNHKQVPLDFAQLVAGTGIQERKLGLGAKSVEGDDKDTIEASPTLFAAIQSCYWDILSYFPERYEGSTISHFTECPPDRSGMFPKHQVFFAYMVSAQINRQALLGGKLQLQIELPRANETYVESRNVFSTMRYDPSEDQIISEGGGRRARYGESWTWQQALAFSN